MAVFDLLRQLAAGTEIDPETRIEELEKRKAQIDTNMKRIRDGHLFLMGATQVRDRFLLMAGTARGLLSGFREVEQNFRNLDRGVRARIAGWEDGKGALLQEIFCQRDAIADSDLGKSFRSFWDFLMSPARQEELSELLQVVFKLEAVQELAPDRRLLRIHYVWLEAAKSRNEQSLVFRNDCAAIWMIRRGWRTDASCNLFETLSSIRCQSATTLPKRPPS